MGTMAKTAQSIVAGKICLTRTLASIGFKGSAYLIPWVNDINVRAVNSLCMQEYTAMGIARMKPLTCNDDKIIPQYNTYVRRQVSLQLQALQKNIRLCEMIDASNLLGGSLVETVLFLMDLIYREARTTLRDTMLEWLITGLLKNTIISKDGGCDNARATFGDDGGMIFEVTTEAQLIGLVDSIRNYTLRLTENNLPSGTLHLYLPMSAVILLEKDMLKRNCCNLGRLIHDRGFGSDSGVYVYSGGLGGTVYIHTAIPDGFLPKIGTDEYYFYFWSDRMKLTYYKEDIFSITDNNHGSISDFSGTDTLVNYRFIRMNTDELIPLKFQMLAWASIDRICPYAGGLIKIDSSVIGGASTGLITPTIIPASSKPLFGGAGDVVMYDTPSNPNAKNAKKKKVNTIDVTADIVEDSSAEKSGEKIQNVTQNLDVNKIQTHRVGEGR